MIRSRQSPEIVGQLERLAWWDWDRDTMRARLDDFRSLSAAGFLDPTSREADPLDQPRLDRHVVGDAHLHVGDADPGGQL